MNGEFGTRSAEEKVQRAKVACAASQNSPFACELPQQTTSPHLILPGSGQSWVCCSLLQPMFSYILIRLEQSLASGLKPFADTNE
jgi:hypothetical protein